MVYKLSGCVIFIFENEKVDVTKAISVFFNLCGVVFSTGLPMNEFEFSSYPWCHQDNLPYEVDAHDVLMSF